MVRRTSESGAPGVLGPARTRTYDAGALLARCAIGWVLVELGRRGAADGFAEAGAALAALGVPSPHTAAATAAYLAVAGGAALALGLAVPLVGTAVAVLMGAELWLHHNGHVLLVEGSHQLPLALGAAALILAVNAGRFSADHVLRRRRRKRRPGGDPVTASAKRPEQAPPLPYSEAQTVFRS